MFLRFTTTHRWCQKILEDEPSTALSMSYPFPCQHHISLNLSLCAFYENCMQQTQLCALSLNYISRKVCIYFMYFVCFLKRLCMRAKKYSKWKYEKWEFNKIKCALKSSQHLGVLQFYIYKAHTRYISLSVCRRSGKRIV